MSQNGPATPPGPPVPDPHARRGVRWTIVGIVISTVIALVSLYFQAQQSKGDIAHPTPSRSASAEPGPTPDDGSPGGDPPSPTPDGSGPDGSGPDGEGPDGEGPDDPSPSPYSGDDGLTLAEHELRDSLNTDQWSRDSCSHTLWQGATAALYCTVTTVDRFGVTGTGKASVVMYETKTDRDRVFQGYAGTLPEGNCEAQINVRGSWSENNTGRAAGDVVCFLSTTGQYVFLCSYYDRPALVQITGPDQSSLTAWWHTMEPVFTG